ncbi:MAG: hypothetical protein A4E48_02505 [Methanosaeta sp. PtaU1.Bin060]|nr:MAG: hypothetical protein A4E48_02505 [Methanosaeta sp. PtaU1.Bin060]
MKKLDKRVDLLIDSSRVFLDEEGRLGGAPTKVQVGVAIDGEDLMSRPGSGAGDVPHIDAYY